MSRWATGAPLCCIVLACGAAFLGAALAAPLLYALGQWAVRSDLIPQLRPHPFKRYFNRALLLCGVGAVATLGLVLRQPRAPAVAPAQKFFHGFALAAGGVLALAAAAWLGGILVWQQLPPGSTWVAAACTAALVGPLEEWLFRGALLGALRQAWADGPALGCTTFVFVVLHFIRPDPSAPPMDPITATSGIELLPQLLWQFAAPHKIAWLAATLALMGWTLGVAVVRSGSLWMSIGLHCGWVFALRLIAVALHRPEPSLWLGDDLRGGLGPLLLMATTLVYLCVGARRGPRQASAAIGAAVSPPQALGTP